MPTPNTEDSIRRYLEAHVAHPSLIHNVLAGFDREKPIYECTLEPGTELLQFMRRPGSGRPDLRVGNWFCLKGATRAGLSIFDGLAGRELHRFQVTSQFSALEGTASRISVNWEHAIGGGGGSTQIFVPPRLLGHLRSLGHTT